MRLLPIYLLLLCSRLTSQNFDSLSRHVDFALKNISSYHYAPPVFGKTEKEEVLDLFVKEADERRILILESDRSSLAGILQSAESNEVYDAFIRKALTIFITRARQGDSILSKLEAKPIEFSNTDTVIFFPNNQKRVLCAELKSLARRLNRLVKYDCLSQLVEHKQDSAVKQGQSAQAKSIKRLRQYYSRHKQANVAAQFITDCLCNSLANRCDPHSSFFNIRQMDDFNRSLSMSELSFGFELDEDEEENVILSELVPGGPAWKSNNLSENDVLLAYRLGNGKEISVVPGDLNSVYEDFSKSSAKQVELKVRKKDLKILSLKLNKEKIQSQENRMNSYVVNYDGKKMGYIPIPSFYLDDEEDSRQGCANDVAKEIIELKQDSVQGLILDLRYNGGGSMREAVGLAGIFIDEGPVAVYKPRTGRAVLIKDLNRGTMWDGPLILLVNSGSASASEFVAATLQDYNRAVIVGSRTFGKSTAQGVLLNDSSSLRQKRGQKNESPFGYMKLTMAKFYRVTTKSHQGFGIEPDVYIPGIIEKVMVKENELPFSMAGDTVAKKMAVNFLPALPKSELRQKSGERIAGSPAFKRIVQLGDSLKSARNKEDRVVMTQKSFENYFKKQRDLDNHIDLLFTNQASGIAIANNSANQVVNGLDEGSRKNAEQTLDVIKKDLILHESIFVLNDLINLLNK